MINNHYLFSSQFRSYLHAQELEDPEFFEGFITTVSSFLRAAGTAELEALTQRVIAPILAQLQFANPPLEAAPTAPAARYAYLYDGFPLRKRVSCVYVASVPLDAAEKGNFPAFDLIRLLKEANLEWGLLTNGMVWRLYSTRAPQPYEQYLEIDFSDAQPEDFKIFWQLFSLALFLPDEQGIAPLETYIAESQQEAAVIEKHIKSKIEALLENICVGLLTYAGKDKQALTEAEQQSYFENAVYLLFRLLFVLYAESRELLPVSNPGYQAVSLQGLIRQAHAWKQAGLVNGAGVELWDGFRDLCNRIQFGDLQSGIPEYDGGLFDSNEHPFLSDARNKVSNLYFVNVLDLLGYRTARKEAQPINYRDLSVRSLGSLYEGILEYKLFLATEELVLRGQTLIPRKEAGKVKKTERVIAPGQVYFAQAANERHDTGSYYTPEEVVGYMVQHSVRVGLEERWRAFQPTVERYAREARLAVSEDVQRALGRKFDQELLDFVETQVLSFKVLDPAMGSGHFLVSALHAITHFILEALQGGGDAGAASLPARHNPAIDLTPGYWRRKAAERCIFGVDLNPLAAELAKLSLWIASAAAGKPLTFLNHHLKCGDSLLGVRLENLLTYPGAGQQQMTIWDMIDREQINGIKAQFQGFLAGDSDQIEQIHSKKDAYAEIEENRTLKHLKDMATLWLLMSLDANKKKNRDLFEAGPHYPDERRYFELLQQAQTVESDAEWETAVGQKLLTRVKAYQNRQRLCHWELEFPEIISEGFDAVISNPPYIRQERLGSQKEVLQYLYPETYSGAGDIYIYFFDRGFQLLRENMLLCFIASNKWTRARYGEPFRQFILNHASITCYLDFSDIPLFGKVIVATSVLVLQKTKKQADFQLCKFAPDIQRMPNLNTYIKRHATFYPHSRLELEAFSFANPIESTLKQKMEEIGTPLKEWNVSIYRGFTTGYNEAFAISTEIKDELIAKDPKNAEIIKPLLRGRDIKRYSYDFVDKWLLFIPWHFPLHHDNTISGVSQSAEEIFRSDYPSLYEHLLKYKPELSKRNKSETGITYEWYALQRWAAQYFEEFEKEKIVWMELSDKANFALDTDKHYTLNTSFIMTGKSLKYLLACLNSKLSEWYFYQISTSSGAGTTRWIKYKIEQLLIPQISETEQQPFINLVDQIIARKRQKEDTAALEQEIDRLVYALYGLSEAEIALVEGRGKTIC